MTGRRRHRVRRHAFRFQVGNKIHTVWAEVFIPRSPVDLVLRAGHVRESIRLKGVGNTQTCTMAVCALRQVEAFSHPVDGFIDWWYRRAYVVSKTRNGLPCECYVYAHDDGIGRLNDSKGGQRKLLRQLERDGDRIIHLVPIRSRRENARPTGQRNRQLSRVIMQGPKLRFAVAQLGGVPA